MWQPRELPALDSKYGGTKEQRHNFAGQNGATVRLGRAAKLHQNISGSEAKKLVRQKKALYVPVLLEACKEKQLSYEYREGAVSYGAFTYSLIKNLRAAPDSSFKQLMAETAKSLQDLQYDQTPNLVGPSAVLSTPVSKV